MQTHELRTRNLLRREAPRHRRLAAFPCGGDSQCGRWRSTRHRPQRPRDPPPLKLGAGRSAAGLISASSRSRLKTSRAWPWIARSRPQPLREKCACDPVRARPDGAWPGRQGRRPSDPQSFPTGFRLFSRAPAVFPRPPASPTTLNFYLLLTYFLFPPATSRRRAGRAARTPFAKTENPNPRRGHAANVLQPSPTSAMFDDAMFRRPGPLSRNPKRSTQDEFTLRLGLARVPWGGPGHRPRFMVPEVVRPGACSCCRTSSRTGPARPLQRPAGAPTATKTKKTTLQP